MNSLEFRIRRHFSKKDVCRTTINRFFININHPLRYLLVPVLRKNYLYASGINEWTCFFCSILDRLLSGFGGHMYIYLGFHGKQGLAPYLEAV